MLFSKEIPSPIPLHLETRNERKILLVIRCTTLSVQSSSRFCLQFQSMEPKTMHKFKLVEQNYHWHLFFTPVSTSVLFQQDMLRSNDSNLRVIHHSSFNFAPINKHLSTFPTRSFVQPQFTIQVFQLDFKYVAQTFPATFCAPQSFTIVVTYTFCYSRCSHCFVVRKTQHPELKIWPKASSPLWLVGVDDVWCARDDVTALCTRNVYMPSYAGPSPPWGHTQLIFWLGSLMSQVLQWIQFWALIWRRFPPPSTSTNSYTPTMREW